MKVLNSLLLALISRTRRILYILENRIRESSGKIALDRNKKLTRTFKKTFTKSLRFASPEDRRPKEKCKHLKGASRGPKNLHKDYNVSMHTFPDGRTRVCCLQCTWISWQGDENWEEALRMVDQSTNTASKSEVAVKFLKS
jgi:hypothetical protein